MSESEKNMDEIWVNQFNEISARKFYEAVYKQVDKFKDDNCPIIVYIDSYGGYADSLLSMLETIDSIPNPVITVCIGKAMSCGAFLLSHGDIRFCGPHSRIMVHEVSGGTEGDVHDMANDSKEGKRLNSYLLGLLAKNCGIKGGYKSIRKIFKEHDGREIYLDAKKAKKFGIVDEVGMPLIKPTLDYKIENIYNEKS
jgi:ATP-dependent Clp protease protease subunit